MNTTSTENGIILEGQGIAKNFGGLAAVSQVDFHVGKGEILGLIGPNGAGKTTLFNMISGAMPPTRGTIKFVGEEVTRLSAVSLCKRGIGRTFQKGRLFPNLSVFENVLLATLFGRPKRVSNEEARIEANRLLEFVGLVELKDHAAKDLTLARQRRVEIARALATKPILLLLDEALAGLTATEVQQGTELIREIQSTGVTVFMIEHVMKAIMDLSDRVLVLHHGKKLTEGTPSEIAASELVREIYFGEKMT